MGAGIVTLTDSDFGQEVLQSNELALVDFWAEWCAPCRALGPIIEDVAKSHAGRVKVGKMNIDENPSTPGKYAVRAIPTVMLFKNGQLVDQVVGLVSKAKLEELISKHS